MGACFCKHVEELDLQKNEKVKDLKFDPTG